LIQSEQRKPHAQQAKGAHVQSLANGIQQVAKSPKITPLPCTSIG
jgi:hypothetical protein